MSDAVETVERILRFENDLRPFEEAALREVLAENKRLRDVVDMQRAGNATDSERLEKVLAEIERLRAEAIEGDKAYDYELRERRACEAKIETALAEADMGGCDCPCRRTLVAVVKALRGGDDE